MAETSIARRARSSGSSHVLVEQVWCESPLPRQSYKNVLGWRDKIEQEITGKDGAAFAGIQVTFVTPDGHNPDN